MSTGSVIVAMALGPNIGRCAKLVVEDTGGADIVKNCALETDPDYFDPALKTARDYGQSLLCVGDRHSGFEWRMEPCDAKGPLPDLEGDSLYGAFAMLFLQLLTETLPENVLSKAPAQVRCLIPAIRGVCLSTVAITAAPGCHGAFRTVEGIPEKFSCLADLDCQLPPVCLVARDQHMGGVPHKVLARVKPIEAHDALDAFGLLFKHQSRSYVMDYV